MRLSLAFNRAELGIWNLSNTQLLCHEVDTLPRYDRIIFPVKTNAIPNCTSPCNAFFQCEYTSVCPHLSPSQAQGSGCGNETGHHSWDKLHNCNSKLYPSSGCQLLHANTIESSVNKVEVAKEMIIHALGSRAPPPWMD